MAKMILSDQEIGLIKGLIQHRAMNDQQVLAIFSFLARNFNHREIGAIRKGAKPRYVGIAAATVPEVDALLYQYSKLAALAEQLGFYATTHSEAQVRKAVDLPPGRPSFITRVLGFDSRRFRGWQARRARSRQIAQAPDVLLRGFGCPARNAA